MKIRITEPVKIAGKTRTVDEIVARNNPIIATLTIEIEDASCESMGNRLPTTEFEEGLLSAVRQALNGAGIKQTEPTQKQRELHKTYRRW